MSELLRAVRLLTAKKDAREVVALARRNVEVQEVVCGWKTPWSDLLLQLVHTENASCVETAGEWVAAVDGGRACEALQMALHVADNYIHAKEHVLTEMLAHSYAAPMTEPAWIRGIIADGDRIGMLRAAGGDRPDLDGDQTLFSLLANRLFRWWARADVLSAVDDDALLRAGRLVQVMCTPKSRSLWTTAAADAYLKMLSDPARSPGRANGAVPATFANLVTHVTHTRGFYRMLMGRHVPMLRALLRAMPFVESRLQRAELLDATACVVARCTEAELAQLAEGGLPFGEVLVPRALVRAADTVAEEGTFADIVLVTISICRVVTACTRADPRTMATVHGTLTELLTAMRKFGEDPPPFVSGVVRRMVTLNRADFLGMDACCSDADREQWWWALDAPPAARPAAAAAAAAAATTADAISMHPMLPADPVYYFQGYEDQPLRLEGVLRFEADDGMIKNPFTNLRVPWRSVLRRRHSSASSSDLPSSATTLDSSVS